MIDIEIIKEASKFYSIREQWNSLLEVSGVNSPLLTHEWLSSWLTAYCRNKQLNVIIFKRNGETLGFIPLVLFKDKLSGFPIKTLSFFPDHWGSMDFILTKDKNECIKEFINWFYRSSRSDVLILSRLDEKSENTKLLNELLSKNKIKIEKTNIHNAYINLNTNWDLYLSQRSKKFRYWLRRLEKQCTDSGKFTYQRVSDFSNPESTLIELKKVSEKSWKNKDKIGLIGTREGHAFYSEIMKKWGHQGYLDIVILKFDDYPIGFSVGVVYKERYLAFESTFNEGYAEYSPGMMIDVFLLKGLFSKKQIKEFETGEVDNYKNRWTEDYKQENKFILYKNSLYPHAVFYLRKFIKNCRTKPAFSYNPII
jgi:CelD/BcsL family acetyltransferase involved in cellulose biosynthesis